MKGDGSIQFFIGVCPDDEKGPQVLVDFRLRMVDHLKLTPDAALEMAEGLVEAAREAAKYGRLIYTGKDVLFPGGG